MNTEDAGNGERHRLILSHSQELPSNIQKIKAKPTKPINGAKEFNFYLSSENVEGSSDPKTAGWIADVDKQTSESLSLGLWQLWFFYDNNTYQVYYVEENSTDSSGPRLKLVNSTGDGLAIFSAIRKGWHSILSLLSSIIGTIFLSVIILAVFVWYRRQLTTHGYDHIINQANAFHEKIKNEFSFGQVDQGKIEFMETYVKESCPIFEVSFNEFKEALVEIDGRIKNTINSPTFMGIEDIIIANSKKHIFASAPSVLTTLGILGTFLGLMGGVGNLSIADPDALFFGIEDLMAGLGTAFMTSIVGIALSLVFQFKHKTKYADAVHALHKVQDRLDRSFQRLNTQELLIRSEKSLATYFQRQTMGDENIYYLLEKANSQNIQMIQRLDALSASQQQLNSAIGSEFFEKIAVAITGPMKDVSDLIASKLMEIGDTSNTQGAAIAKKMTDDLFAVQKDFSDRMSGFNSVQEDLQQSLSEVSQRLRELIQSNIEQSQQHEEQKSTFSQLVGQIEKTVNSLALSSSAASERLHADLRQSASTLQANSTQQATLTSDLLTKCEDLVERVGHLGTTQGDTLKEMGRSLDAIKSISGDILNAQREAGILYKTIIPEINESLQRTSHLSKESVSSLGNVVLDLKSQGEKSAALLQQHDKAYISLTEFSKAAGTTFTVAQEVQTKALRAFDDANKENSERLKLITDVSNNLKIVHDAIDATAKAGSESIDGFKEVVSSLNEAIKNYDQKIEAYNEKINKGLSTAFGEFDAATVRFGNNLTQSVSTGTEAIELANSAIENSKSAIEEASQALKLLISMVEKRLG